VWQCPYNHSRRGARRRNWGVRSCNHAISLSLACIASVPVFCGTIKPNQRLGPTARCGAAADAGGTATGGGPALTLGNDPLRAGYASGNRKRSSFFLGKRKT
jgi:type IV secretory pathway TrbL component